MAIHSPKELEGCGHELKFEDTASCTENRIQMPHSLFPSFEFIFLRDALDCSAS